MEMERQIRGREHSRTENVLDSTMEDRREEDKLEDMICDVGVEVFACACVQDNVY